MHQPREVERLARRNPVIVHDVERIAGLPHVQPRQRAPGAADGIECAALALAENVEALEGIGDQLLGLLDRLAGQVLQGQAAERQRQTVPHAGTVHVDQFERAAAKIADNAVRLVDTGDDAERGEMRLALARQDFDFGATDALGLGDEGTAVPGIAAGGGGDRPNLGDVLNVAQGAEPYQSRERGIDGFLRQEAGGLHLTAETGEHLLVENRRRRPGQALVNHKAHRVRTDVDDGYGRTVVEPALDRLMANDRALMRLRRCAG